MCFSYLTNPSTNTNKSQIIEPLAMPLTRSRFSQPRYLNQSHSDPMEPLNTLRSMLSWYGVGRSSVFLSLDAFIIVRATGNETSTIANEGRRDVKVEVHDATVSSLVALKSTRKAEDSLASGSGTPGSWE
jgi:hypothetical protein